MNAQLFAMGELRLAGDGADIQIARRKELVLLAYILRQPSRGAGREELAALLWGERDDERARQSLRQALARLKKAVRDGLEITPERVRVVNGAPTLDANEFEREISSGQLLRAVGRWNGDFLPGTEDIGGEAYRVWLEQERLVLRRKLGLALAQLTARAREDGDRDAEYQWARTWARHVPDDDHAHEHLLLALLRRDELPDAVAHFALLRGTATADGRELPAALRQLGDEIRRRERQLAGHTASSAAVGTPLLVGRQAELDVFQRRWRSVRAGAGATILVEGAEGIGRTRLCREIVRLAAETDGVVLQTRAIETDPGHPFSATRRLLNALSTVAGLAGADPRSLAHVATVVPAIRERFPGLPGSPHGDLARAMSETLEAVADENPVLLVLDDVHAVDTESRDLLTTLVAHPPPRTLLVLTAPTGALSDRAMGSDLGDASSIERLKLQSLAVHDVERLVESMIALPPADRVLLATRAHAETGGTPLLLVELIAALADSGTLQRGNGGSWYLAPESRDQPLPLAAEARQRVSDQLSALPPAARHTLEAASVIGSRIDARLLEAIANVERVLVDHAVDELIRRRFLKTSSGSARIYEFANEVVRRAVYERIPPAERHALHVAAEAALARTELGTAGQDRAHHRAAARELKPISRRRRRKRGVIVGAVSAITGAILVGLTLSDAPAASRPDQPLLLVATFENQTGDTRLDALGRIAADWITQGASRTSLVRVTPPILERPDSGAGDSRDRLLRIRKRAAAAKADLAIYGTYYLLNDSLRFEAHVMDVRTGEELSAATPVIASNASPLDAIDRVRQAALGALAPWVDDRLRAGAAVQSRPSTFDAYKSFAEGLSLYYGRRGDSAVTAFMRAYAIDSTFTLPLMYALVTMSGASQYARAESLIQHILPRRTELAPYDRLMLDIQLGSLRYDKAAVYSAARDAAKLAPGTYAAAMLPAAALAVNRPREALQHLLPVDTTVGEGSRYPGYWSVVSSAAHMTGDFALQLRVGKIVRGKFSYDPRYLHYEARALAAMGSFEQLDALLLESLQWPSIPEWGPPGIRVHFAVFDELMAHGHTAGAAEILERALQYYANAPAAVRNLPKHRHDVGRVLARLGRLAEARALFEELEREVGTWAISLHEIKLQVGIIAARQGDSVAVAKFEQWMDDNPTLYRAGSDTMIRAILAAHGGRPERAVRFLQQAISEGAVFSDDLHSSFELSPLQSYPPFIALLKPIG